MHLRIFNLYRPQINLLIKLAFPTKSKTRRKGSADQRHKYYRSNKLASTPIVHVEISA